MHEDEGTNTDEALQAIREAFTAELETEEGE
jgi:hypothetical protein